MAIKGESVKKGKFVTKIFFLDNVKWSPKKLQKMIYAHVKADVKEIKELVVVSFSCNFYKKYWKLEMQVTYPDEIWA